MGLEGIITEVSGWGYNDKVDLFHSLEKMIYEEKAKNEIPQYIATMENLLGRPIGNDRSRDNVEARAVLSWELSKIGYKSTTIGEALNRDHSSITHLKGLVSSAILYPKQYPSLIKLYVRFIEALAQREPPLPLMENN